MKQKVLILFLLIQIKCLAQDSTRVINYPIDLVYNKYLRFGLEEMGYDIQFVRRYQNTYISTMDYIKRDVYMDPVFSSYYYRNDIPLYQIDSLVLECLDSLRKTNPRTFHEGTITLFKKFYKEKKGHLVYIDYSKINYKSKTLEDDLKKIGLNDKEIKIFIDLLKKEN